ncbi:hypothetical protein J437_LFUL004113 [Ladona fulva]|uniref:Lactate/malate dehydrogenase C-terminal domain-containing protein n=1 Tax=Ladona fulva TaxID=123851 RepID=A0A8K0JVU3_LADFU|nr:hypothetical protein J437_LFUL004113 [Ladona fulva]
MDKVAKKSVRVLVVGNPANTNALVCSKYAPSIPKENFSAMTRLDENRARSEIATRLKVSVAAVRGVTIWGNHSSTQFPDASHAKVMLKPGQETAVYEAIGDDKWLQSEFIEKIQKRGAEVIKARKLSSAMSAAKAAADHMHDIWHGTPPNTWVSMGVFSDGSYGTTEGVMFSFPVTIENKQWKIGLSISAFAKGKMDITGKELAEEREEALAVCQD